MEKTTVENNEYGKTEAFMGFMEGNTSSYAPECQGSGW